MGKNGNIHPTRILNPEKEFELPYKKNKDGNYIILGNKKTNSNISKTNAKRFPNGYIYLIKIVNQDVYKLGVSRNPKRRLSDIDSYLPYDFEILAINYFKNVYDVEKEISESINEFNLKREWYNLSKSKAAEIMIYLHNKQVKNECA